MRATLEASNAHKQFATNSESECNVGRNFVSTELVNTNGYDKVYSS